MSRIATSGRLVKASWNVVKADKELLWMPVLSFLASAIAVLSVAGVTWVAWPEVFDGGDVPAAQFVLDAVLYIALAFIAVYFHAATVAAARERLSGGDPTLGSALGTANKHLGRLFLWALVVATVNIVLRALRERAGAAGAIVSWIGGVAWNLASYFVVPHLMATDDGIGESLRASGRTFKRRWGETIAGHIGIGLAVFVAGVAWVLIGLVLIMLLATLGTVGIVVGITIVAIGIAVLVAIATVLEAVFKTALYRYARGEDTGLFGGVDLAHAVR